MAAFMNANYETPGEVHAGRDARAAHCAAFEELASLEAVQACDGLEELPAVARVGRACAGRLPRTALWPRLAAWPDTTR